MRIGFSFMAAALLFLILVPYSKPIFYLFYIFQVIGGIIFYIPLNILYFEGVDATAHMRGMAWYWILGIIAGVFGPLIAAFLFVRTGLAIYIAIPILILCIGIYLCKFAPAQTISYTIFDAVDRLKGIRIMNILDGALHRVNGDTGLFVLLFVTTVSQYGNFLSFVSLMMALVAWLLAKESDRTNHRMKYLWPAAVIAGLATISFTFAHTLTIFLLLTIITRSALIIAEPLRSNVMQDTIPPHAFNWISREFYLQIGRACIQTIAGLILLYGSASVAFILFGAMHIIYPILVHRKKIYVVV
jgi:MFS family permease